MAHTVVKMTIDDSGEKHPSNKWHLVISASGSRVTLCTGESFGEGEGNASGVQKFVRKGNITCKKCLSFIYMIKMIEL